MLKMLLKLITTLGVGLLPGAPGTWGSLLTCALAWAWLASGGTALYGLWYLILIAGVTGLALLTTHFALKRKVFGEKHDPGAIVIDEAAGQLVALYGLAGDQPLLLFLALVAFRLFDIFKPFPVNISQRLPGAWGVVIDDLVAGVYALVVVLGARLLLQNI